MSSKSRHIFSRRYYGLDGEPVEITISRAAWAILDRLVKDYNYPVAELIDDAKSDWLLHDFNDAFEQLVYMSDDACRIVFEGLANDNIRAKKSRLKYLTRAFSAAA